MSEEKQMMPEQRTKEITAEVYKGVSSPKVELKAESFDSKESHGMENIETIEESLSISLENLVSDMHNQSYGMISASTGCISNPGGPSC